ncbi:hypothetical protein, partial [Phenylobacterium sp.]|uniref:hypothetical protein n=1 Tax=Phenylobacterium sp. TaxID=1871053 RepID=UPI0025E25C3E
MEPAPPALTPEHIDSLFALMAEAGAVGVRKVQARLQAAETDEAVERMSRSLQTVGRYLRQTLALKLRFDREQAQVAVEQRHAAEQQRQDAERVHADARGRHRKRVRDHFARLLWTEYEADDAQEIFNDLDDRLGDLAEDAAFLGTPIETLIARLT